MHVLVFKDVFQFHTKPPLNALVSPSITSYTFNPSAYIANSHLLTKPALLHLLHSFSRINFQDYISLISITMSPFLLCLLIICFPIHACNARYLQDISKGLIQDVDKVSLQYDTSPISEEFGAQERVEVGKIDRRLGASTMKLKNVGDVLRKEEGTKEAPTGSGLTVSSRKDLQQTAKIEGLKGRERSMVEAAPSDTEEAVKSNENHIAEDVVVMDYAQPHRKPPIHNEKA